MTDWLDVMGLILGGAIGIFISLLVIEMWGK